MGMEGESGAERVDGLRRRSGQAFFALELHSDLDEIQRVGGAACNNGSYASLNEAFDTH